MSNIRLRVAGAAPIGDRLPRRAQTEDPGALSRCRGRRAGSFFVATETGHGRSGGTVGLSSQRVSEGARQRGIEQWLTQNYDRHLVLMDDIDGPSDPSRRHSNGFVHCVATSPTGREPWQPGTYSQWVILRSRYSTQVWTRFARSPRHPRRSLRRGLPQRWRHRLERSTRG